MVTKRILVIDDEADMREVVQVSLELMAGLNVITASCGYEGLELAITKQPDAILLDVMLPDIDGVAVFQALQTNPMTQHIPVFFLTAKVSASDHDHFADLGIKATFTKPFKPARLVAQLLDILGWSHN